MTWAAIAVGAMCSTAYLIGLWVGRKRGKREQTFEAHIRGQREGLVAAYNTAKAALDLPAEGKPRRSPVGRAIVRKLKALAEGTDTNNNGAQA